MLPSLINFVMFGSDTIKTRPDYKQMFVDIYTTSITNDQLGENDRVNGSKLVESILLSLRGHLDEVCLMKSFEGKLSENTFLFLVPSDYYHHFSQPRWKYPN